MQTNRISLFFVAVVLFGSSCKSSTEPDPAPYPGVRLSPSELTLSQGEEGTITLYLEAIETPIFAVSLRIRYDETVASLSSSSDFIQDNYFGSQSVNFLGSNSTTIHLSASLTQGQSPIAGSADLAQLVFKGVSNGSGDVAIVPYFIHFYDSVGAEITIIDLEIDSALIKIE